MTQTEKDRLMKDFKRETADTLAMAFATHIMESLSLDPIFDERADNIGTELDILGADHRTVERVNVEIQMMLALAVQKTMLQWMATGGQYWSLAKELHLIPAVERMNIMDIVHEDEIQTVISSASGMPCTYTQTEKPAATQEDTGINGESVEDA